MEQTAHWCRFRATALSRTNLRKIIDVPEVLVQINLAEESYNSGQ